MARCGVMRFAAWLCLAAGTAMLAACGSASLPSSPLTPASPSAPSTPSNPGNPSGPPTPQHGFVVLVIEENHGYEQVIGSPDMPYLNSLAQQGALATQYYADAHPSLPNYLELTTGAIETFDDNFKGIISNDNLAREITAAGKTWKAYLEDLPSPGYLGPDTGNYIRHHNPFAYFSDINSNPAQAANIVPFTQFAADLNSGALPAFSLVVPNVIDDAHNCPNGPATCSDDEKLSRADQWLRTNIGALLASSQFQNGNGLLLITFDEAFVSDIRHGGGHVPLILVGPKVKAGAQSSVLYQHENTLKTVCDALALSTCPGAGATVSGEGDLFQQ